MSINCIIVDDEPIAQRIIMSYLNDLKDYEVIATCNNAIEANEVLYNKKIDLMFLDLEMPKIKGLSFLKTLKNPPAVIITTAYREFALEGFELDVIDYLLKPISFERFLKALNKYNKISETSNYDQEKTEKIIYLKSDRKTLRIKENDILYIEGMSNYVLVHLKDKKHSVYISLTELKSKLSNNFIRIHKSYIINKSSIVSFNKENIELGNVSLPIGKSYKNIINEI